MTVIQFRHPRDNEVSRDGPRRQDDEQPSDFLFDEVPEHGLHSDLCRGDMSNDLAAWSQVSTPCLLTIHPEHSGSCRHAINGDSHIARRIEGEEIKPNLAARETAKGRQSKTATSSETTNGEFTKSEINKSEHRPEMPHSEIIPPLLAPLALLFPGRKECGKNIGFVR